MLIAVFSMGLEIVDTQRCRNYSVFELADILHLRHCVLGRDHAHREKIKTRQTRSGTVVEFEWRFDAFSASNPILRARTYSRITSSVCMVMMIT